MPVRISKGSTDPEAEEVMGVRTVQDDAEVDELIKDGWLVAGVSARGWHMVLPDQSDGREVILDFLNSLDPEVIDNAVLSSADLETPGGSAAVIAELKKIVGGQPHEPAVS